jgi:two-component system chemotaxis sensor kinase CheA
MPMLRIEQKAEVDSYLSVRVGMNRRRRRIFLASRGTRKDHFQRSSMDEIVKDFLIESNENLDRLDQELVKLESEPSSPELLASIFRTIHTIKGSCGFLGFYRLEKLTHAGENLLSQLRDGDLTLNAEITTALLGMVDAVRQMLAAIQASGKDGEEGYASLIELLARLQGAEPAESPATSRGNTAAGLPPLQPPEEGSQIGIASTPASGRLVENRLIESAAGRIVFAPEQPGTEQEGEHEAEQHKTSDVAASAGARSEEAATIVEPRNPDAAVETIRVGVTLLNRLMNLVGELVLARNQLLQFTNSTQDPVFQAVSQRMNLITTELQEEVMKTRMQPIGNIWSKFPRTVRDLALSCGKEVRLEMEGQDTELDRTIIEAIKDPLTHLVRNSVDHGIEGPEIRKRVGKDLTGVLTLRAFHESGQVNIEINDDGGGLNAVLIRQKALDRELISAAQFARMPDRDVFNLIFLPGFSTAEKITKVSGRGVGMDVVKTNVEKIGGSVDVQSTPGRGTTVRVRIPLTLAIIPALVVTCGGERFAIPQVSLSELVRLSADENGKRIELVRGVPVYRLRGRLLPLVYLDRELGLRTATAAGRGAKGTGPINIVVLQAEGQQFGLIVDEITDTEEIVVKPLGKQLKGISAYSGATIMGDGRVALILDVPGLAQRAKVVAEAREPAHNEAPRQPSMETVRSENALLLAENGAVGRVAIPLATVARLEEFPKTVIEYSGAQEVMQYRGQIIPLVRLSDVIPAERDAETAANASSIQVVVYAEGNRTVGLIVDRIVDIVEEPASVEALAPRDGIVGSFVTQRQVTDLLDLPAIVRSAVPGLLTAPESQPEGM